MKLKILIHAAVWFAVCNLGASEYVPSDASSDSSNSRVTAASSWPEYIQGFASGSVAGPANDFVASESGSSVDAIDDALSKEENSVNFSALKPRANNYSLYAALWAAGFLSNRLFDSSILDIGLLNRLLKGKPENQDLARAIIMATKMGNTFLAPSVPDNFPYKDRMPTLSEMPPMVQQNLWPITEAWGKEGWKYLLTLSRARDLLFRYVDTVDSTAALLLWLFKNQTHQLTPKFVPKNDLQIVMARQKSQT